MTGQAATYCPRCGRVFDSNVKTCPHCSIGLSVQGQGWRCRCGTQNDATNAFCAGCGYGSQRRELGDWICNACGARGVGKAETCMKCGKSLSVSVGDAGYRGANINQNASTGDPPMNITPRKVWECSNCKQLNPVSISACSSCSDPRTADEVDLMPWPPLPEPETSGHSGGRHGADQKLGTTWWSWSCNDGPHRGIDMIEGDGPPNRTSCSTCYSTNIDYTRVQKVSAGSETVGRAAISPQANYQCSNCGYVSSSPGACPYCSSGKPMVRSDMADARRQGNYQCSNCGYVSSSPGACPYCSSGKPMVRSDVADARRQGNYQCSNCGYVSSSPGACPYCSSGRPMVALSGTTAPVGRNLAASQRPMNGCLFETRSAPAPLFRPRQGSVPQSVDLRPYCSPVESQGTTNSCTANAIVGALEYHQRRSGGAGHKDMSRLFVYYNARKLSDTQAEDCGSFIHHVMAAVLAHGACEESVWPFEKSAITTQPPQPAYKNAELHEAISYARTPLGVSCLEAVAAGLPVVFGTYIPQSFYDEGARTGAMPLPAQRVENPGSGHAMLIVGYDLPGKYWIVRNSWGADWADKGYVRIPFDTLGAYSLADHFWTIGAIEKMAPGSMVGAPLKMAMKAAQDTARVEAREVLSAQRAHASRGQTSPLGTRYTYLCRSCYREFSSPETPPQQCIHCRGTTQVVGYDGDSAARPAPNNSRSGVHTVPAAARGYKGAPLPTSARRLDGCLFEARRSNAPLLQTPMGNVPNAIDLRQYCSPVEDQGRSNSCTANAAVGALEYHQRRSGGAFTDISRLFVYYNSRQLAGAQGEDCGSFIHHSMAAVLAHGACEESVWPFDLAQVLAQPPQDAYKNGTQHEAVQYGRTMLGNPVIQALAAGLPVVFGTYAPSRFYDEAATTGLMPVPAEKLEPPGGGHAMLIVGYDMPSKTWLVRNSWGESWADKGYFRVPFATIEAYSYPDHFWAIGAIEGKQGLSLSGPSPMQAAQAVRAEAAGEVREALNKLRGDLRSDFQAELDKQKTDIRNRLRNPDKT